MTKVKNIKRVPRDLDTNFDFRFGDKLKKSGEIVVAHSTSSNLLPEILKHGLKRDSESVWENTSSGKLFFEIEPTRGHYGENVYGWKSVQKNGGVPVTLYVKVKQNKLRTDMDDADLGLKYQKNQKECTCDVEPENILGLHFVGIDIAPKDFMEFYEMFADEKMNDGGSFEKSVFIHSAEIEHRDSIISNGLRGSKNPVVINGIFTFPEQWEHHKQFNKSQFDKYKIKLKDDAQIFWTDSDRPLDALMGSGNAEYRKAYNEILKNTSLKSKDEVMKALTVDFQSGNQDKWFKWKTEFSRGIEKYLNENGYAGIQQGGEVVITDMSAIESVTLNGKKIKVDNKMEVGGLFHGSPYEFEKFTTEKMSSGEGQQSFGWGLYFTDVEGVAKHYAERLADKDVRIGDTTASKLNEELSNPVFNWIIIYVHENGWNKEQIIDKLNEQLNDTDWLSKNKWVEPKILEAMPILKENEISPIIDKRNLYKVTLHKGNEKNDWLLWDESVTESQKQRILSNLNKLNDGKAKDRLISILKSPEWLRQDTGNKVYEYITDSFSKGLSGQKDASLFLLGIGIDGIKYKVGTLSGNEEQFEGFNYVVFDESAVTIEDKKKFNNGGNLNIEKNKKMKNDNLYVDGGNLDRALENSNAKPEEIISNEINFDTRKGLNRSDKVVSKEIVEEIEEKGMSLERLEELGLPIFKYQTQITVHGVFEGVGSGRIGGYKNLLSNQNQTLGIKYNAIDFEKKKTISKSLKLDREFNGTQNGFSFRMDSKGFQLFKRRQAKDKDEYAKVVEELKSDSEKIPSNFIGKKMVNAYKIWGLVIVELLIDFKAIKQDNLWSFISAITDGRISDENKYNELLNKEKEKEKERHDTYEKERKEREEKEKNLLNELKDKATFNKSTEIPTSNEFIVSALGLSYGDAVIRTYFVFKNKTGRKVYSVNNYKSWSEVPTTISDEIKNSRGNKFFDETTIKILTKYIEKGMLFDIYSTKKEEKKVQPSSIYKTEEKESTIPAGDVLLLDDSRYQLIQSKHTKTGDTIYLFKLKQRVDRDNYKKIEANVKSIRGYYSTFVTAFVLKSAISANEAEMLLKGSSLEKNGSNENGGEISDDKKINDAANNEVKKLVEETDITKEEAVKEMKEGVKVEEEHRETLEKLNDGKITVEQALAETASVHIDEKKDYYTGGLNPMENKGKSNEELKKQLGEVELQLFNKAEERIPTVNLARTIELAENIAKLENKERKSDLAYFAEALQYTTSDAENDVYARFWASDLEYMVGSSGMGFVQLERAIEVGAIEGGESFLEHIDAFKTAAETFRSLINKGHKALIQNFVNKFVLGNELATNQDYIWMAINDVYKLIYFAKQNETDTTKIAEYIGELMTKYQAQTELEKLVNESAKSIQSQTENVNVNVNEQDGIEYTENKYENGTIVYGANVRYKGELSVIPLGRYETKEEVELKANEILENFKQKHEEGLSEYEKIEKQVMTDFPDADAETIKIHVDSRIQANKDNKLFEKAKMEYPIVIEWSEGTSEKNIGFDYLYELDKKIKSFGVTNEPKSYYIKTKVWFRDYQYEGTTDYVTIYNGHDVSDFNPETEDVIDFLKRHYPNFDWTIYEYGENYKFGHIPEPEFKAGDLVRVTIEVKGEGEERDTYVYEYGYITDKKPTYVRKSESWKPHFIYDVVDMFDSEKTFNDVMEWRLHLRTEDEVKHELMEQKLRLGHADLLIKEEAEILADKYIGEINRLHGEYTNSGEGKYWKEQFENQIYTQFYDWFSNVVSRYPLMLGQWLNMQVEKLPNYEHHLLKGFIDVDFALTNLLQFINSLNKINVGKTKPKGIYELIPENFISDKKTKQIDFEVEPSSSGLLSIMKPFMMRDDLRPSMASINFDKYGATSTDAHRLMFLKTKSDKIGIYGFGKIAEESGQYTKRGKYLVGKKDMKYPLYQKVIPSNYKNVITLNREQVQDLVNILKTFKNTSYVNKITGLCYLSFNKGQVSHFNMFFAIDLFEAWLKIGFEKLEVTNTTISSSKIKYKRNILLVSPDLAKFTNNLKGSGSILMGLMIEGGEDVRDIVRGEMYVDVASVTAKTAGVTDDLFTDFNSSFGTYGAETESQEIEEMQMMIDLMEDTVKESPTEENKDYLDLLKETLASLREKNKQKFDCGGKMYYNGGSLPMTIPYNNGGNLFSDDELSNLEKVNHINNTLFYRYYPVGVNPFEVSFEPTNSYGYGIYFLDNPYFYKNKFTNGRLLTVRPRLQNPLVFTSSDSIKTPNSEYAEAYLNAVKNDNIENKDAFTRKMVEAGYDSLVAIEPRGTYLVLFSNDPDLYEVESDLSSDAIDEKVKNELSEKLDTSIQNAISQFPDLNTTEAEFLYNTFNKIIEQGNQKEVPVWISNDGFKGSMKKVLLKKNYIDDFWSVFNKPMSYDRNEYSLTEKGLNFINQVQLGLFGNNEMAKGGGLDKRALKELKLLGFSDEEIKWAEIFQKERDKFGDIVKIKDIPNIKSGDMLGYIYKQEDDKLGDIGSGKVIFSEQWGEWGMNAYPFNMQKREIQENKNNPEFELKDIQNHEYKWTLYHLKKTKKMTDGGEIDNPRALGTALKKVFKNEYKVDIDTRYIKTVRGLDGSWYEISTFNSGHTIPNEVRKELLELSYGKPITELGVSNPNDIYYGNIRAERVSVFGKHWKEWLKTKKFDDGGEINENSPFGNFNKESVKNIILNEGLLYAVKDYMDSDAISKSEPELIKMWDDVRNDIRYFENYNRTQGYDPAYLIGNVNEGYRIISDPKGGEYREVPVSELTPFAQERMKKINNLLLKIINYVGLDKSDFGKKYNDGGETKSITEEQEEEFIFEFAKNDLYTDDFEFAFELAKELYPDVDKNDVRTVFNNWLYNTGRDKQFNMAKGGGVKNSETYFISYLNKDNNFRQTDKVFTGKDAYEKAVKWGKKNLENFNHDMVRMVRNKFSDGGEVDDSNVREKLITILSSLDEKDLSDFIYHFGGVDDSEYVDYLVAGYRDWINNLPKDELDIILWRMKMPYFYEFSPKDNYSKGTPVPSKFATYNDFYEKKYAKGGSFSSLSDLKKAEIKMMAWSEMEVHFEPRGDNGLEGYDRNMIYYYKEYETDSGTGTNKKRYLITNGYNPDSGKVFGEVNDVSSIVFNKYFNKVEKQKED